MLLGLEGHFTSGKMISFKSAVIISGVDLFVLLYLLYLKQMLGFPVDFVHLFFLISSNQSRQNENELEFYPVYPLKKKIRKKCVTEL